MIKFATGKLLLTRGVNDQFSQDSVFARYVIDSLRRHVSGDWGDMCDEDKEENSLALRQGGLRIFSAYEHQSLPKIWIITEADRSATTVLFPDEY